MEPFCQPARLRMPCPFSHMLGPRNRSALYTESRFLQALGFCRQSPANVGDQSRTETTRKEWTCQETSRRFRGSEAGRTAAQVVGERRSLRATAEQPQSGERPRPTSEPSSTAEFR